MKLRPEICPAMARGWAGVEYVCIGNPSVHLVFAFERLRLRETKQGLEMSCTFAPLSDPASMEKFPEISQDVMPWAFGQFRYKGIMRRFVPQFPAYPVYRLVDEVYLASVQLTIKSYE